MVVLEAVRMIRDPQSGESALVMCNGAGEEFIVRTREVAELAFTAAKDEVASGRAAASVKSSLFDGLANALKERVLGSQPPPQDG